MDWIDFGCKHVHPGVRDIVRDVYIFFSDIENYNVENNRYIQTYIQINKSPVQNKIVSLKQNIKNEGYTKFAQIYNKYNNLDYLSIEFLNCYLIEKKITIKNYDIGTSVEIAYSEQDNIGCYTFKYNGYSVLVGPLESEKLKIDLNINNDDKPVEDP